MKIENASNGSGLLVLDGMHARILAFDSDGKKRATILDDCGGTPDGIAVDVSNKHIYWTNMGEHWDQNDGYIERIDFDGSNRKMIIPMGGTFTPKQLQLDLKNGLMYWCDREGMRVMRAELDGTNITVLIESGSGDIDRKDETRHCVGIALDIENEFIYWTQKGPSKAGKGRIFRADLALPQPANPACREDVRLFWDHLPEPIDLELNHLTGQLYWTDRGAPPNGNSLNRAGVHEIILPDPKVLCNDLQEAIGLALDLKNNRVYFGDLGGNLYCSLLNGSKRSIIYSSKDKEMFTGMVYIASGLTF
jgi:hypothetical protein